MMRKIKIHIKAWRIWHKHCLNRPFYKFLVLTGIMHSPTLETLKHNDKEVS